jgi:hypothetical protein
MNWVALNITCSAGMKILARLIRNRMRAGARKWGHCAIYENELQRVWPIDAENRKSKIEQFAKEHGFRLSYYKRELCAIFEKEPPPPS